MVGLCSRIAANGRFQGMILGVIVLNAVLIGLETSQRLVEGYPLVFQWSHLFLHVVFVSEISIRLIAYWPRVDRFFRGGWNVFDFTVVVVSLLPAAGSLVLLVRLARLLRVARLVSALPELRLLVATMLRSLTSIGHVVVLLSVILYIYGVLGFYLFGHIDPANWGTLGRSLLSLFQTLTLESWPVLQRAVMDEQPLAWFYFFSFIIVAVFVVTNLFIAVVINSLEDAKETLKAEAAVKAAAEARAKAREEGTDTPEARVAAIRKSIGTMRAELEKLEKDLTPT